MDSKCFSSSVHFVDLVSLSERQSVDCDRLTSTHAHVATVRSKCKQD